MRISHTAPSSYSRKLQGGPAFCIGTHNPPNPSSEGSKISEKAEKEHTTKTTTNKKYLLQHANVLCVSRVPPMGVAKTLHLVTTKKWK